MLVLLLLLRHRTKRQKVKKLDSLCYVAGGGAERAIQTRDWSGLYQNRTKCLWGVPWSYSAQQEVERSPLTQIASSATLDAESTATELGQDPDVRRNLPMGALCCSAAASARKKLRPPKHSKPENDVHTLHMHIPRGHGFGHGGCFFGLR